MAITKVTTDVITALAVTAPKLAANAVTTDKLADNAVTAAKIAAGALGDQVAGITSSASATTIAGTLTSTGAITGTLATAAQAAITSVGTLTSLAITGDLDIADTGAGAITVGGTTNTYNAPVVINATDLGIAISDGTKTLAMWGVHGGSSHSGSGIGTRSNHDMFIATNDTKRMVFDTSGNVGIGTTTPGSYDARANTLVLGGSGNAGMTIFTGSSSIARLAFAKSGDTGLDEGMIDYRMADNEMRIATGGTDRLTINSDGNVGIGNTAPGSYYSNSNQLVVGSGAARQGITIASSTSTIGQLAFADGTSGDTRYEGSVLYNHNDNHMELSTNHATRIYIDSTGRVGIARTPSITNSKLEVGGADNVSLINVEASGVTGGMGVGSTGLQLFHGSTARMKIQSDGKVLIGTAEAATIGKAIVMSMVFG